MAWKATRKRGNKAVSPAVSAVIITGIMATLITVAFAFASNFLVFRMAESEFNSSKQFMQTLGQQIDDVAWVVGKTETARYSGRYGDVSFENETLNYAIYVNTTTQSNFNFYSITTGIICFNMPVEHYSMGNDYFELIYPSSNYGFLSEGASAPVASVFSIERLPMADGSYVRTVVVPTIRVLSLTIGDTKYVRLYLPILLEGESPKHSQSVTLTGEKIYKLAEIVTGIKVEVDFPKTGFDNFFFNFPETEEPITLTGETVLELYFGEVDVALGVHA